MARVAIVARLAQKQSNGDIIFISISTANIMIISKRSAAMVKDVYRAHSGIKHVKKDKHRTGNSTHLIIKGFSLACCVMVPIEFNEVLKIHFRISGVVQLAQ